MPQSDIISRDVTPRPRISSPQVFTKISEIQEWRHSIQSTVCVGFTPTMGALHEGHATLLRAARARSDFSVLSIFVNPTQFGPKEDLSKYPRTWEHDLKVAAHEGVDIIFAPSPEELYPHGYSTFVEELELSQPLCGQFRPGHFRGVTTIVLKLFNIVQPHLALFGMKDAQQFFVIEKMVRDLNLKVVVEGIPTVRESDGLALSSRNVYLSKDERERAPLLYKTLLKIKAALKEPLKKPLKKEPLKDGFDPIIDLLPYTQSLEKEGFRVQYLECLPLKTGLQTELQTKIQTRQSYLIAVAAYLGQTRLIDNVILSDSL